MELRDIWRRGRGPQSLAARRPLDAGETDEEVARRLQRAEEEDYGGDLVSFE